jgi:hypothetical protein
MAVTRNEARGNAREPDGSEDADTSGNGRSEENGDGGSDFAEVRHGGLMTFYVSALTWLLDQIGKTSWATRVGC